MTSSSSKIQGASILITGANGGMAIQVIQQLLARGAKRIVLACRTQEKAEDAKAIITKDPEMLKILEGHGGFDMSSTQAIGEAVQALPADQPFDIVFLQAGGMVVAKEFQFVTGGDGTNIEKTVFQNAVGGYATLLELEKRKLVAPKARVVFAGGEGARGLAPLMKKPVYTAQEWRKYVTQGGEKYVPLQAIAESKFASALLVQKLATIDMERDYVWFSPGLTGGTNGLRDAPNPKKFIMENICFPLMQLMGKSQNPQKAAEKFVDCLDGKHGESGDLIGAPEGKSLGKLVDQKPMNSCLTDEDVQGEMWNIVKAAVGDISQVAK